MNTFTQQYTLFYISMMWKRMFLCKKKYLHIFVFLRLHFASCCDDILTVYHAKQNVHNADLPTCTVDTYLFIYFLFLCSLKLLARDLYNFRYCIKVFSLKLLYLPPHIIKIICSKNNIGRP